MTRGARAIVGAVPDDNPVIERLEVNGPGFVLCRVKASYLQRQLQPSPSAPRASAHPRATAAAASALESLATISRAASLAALAASTAVAAYAGAQKAAAPAAQVLLSSGL